MLPKFMFEVVQLKLQVLKLPVVWIHLNGKMCLVISVLTMLIKNGVKIATLVANGTAKNGVRFQLTVH